MPANLRLRSLQIERECCIFQMGPDRLAGFPENGRAAQRDPGKRRVCSPSVQTVETMHVSRTTAGVEIATGRAPKSGRRGKRCSGGIQRP
jgi:hypothetical protein